MDPLIAARVRLLDRLGAGGTGTVWRAWDHVRRRIVAAKVVARRRPCEASAGLGPVRVAVSHPHVLTPDEWLVDVERHIGLMRLVLGGTTGRLLADRGALPLTYVVVLLDQLLQGLAALHGAGFVHRDVKPANLLLEPTRSARPHLYLGDLETAARAAMPPETSAGTPGYVAPEARPGAPPDPRHDLYAAGVTAVELLTGRVPRHPGDLPRGPLRALLRDLTDPDPPGRPATADEARARLLAVGVLRGEPWRSGPRPPDVLPRLPPLPLVTRLRLHGLQGLRAAQ
jgi:eukaryotic-like serine/threonine-protein kinase